MALDNKINTAKEVWADSKSRTIVITLVVIVAIILGISYLKLRKAGPSAGMGSAMTGTPDIVSIPGMGHPTREYAKLQEQQNVELAAEAVRTGTSSMPTVVRSTYIDTGVSTDLSKQSGATSAAGCGVEELKLARNSGVVASELRCRGCSLAALKDAGFMVGELCASGFRAKEVQDAGYSAVDSRVAGCGISSYSAKDLVVAGYATCELKNAGISAADARAAGISEDAIKAGGYGISNKLSSGVCDAKKLQTARSKGTSAANFKKLDCSVSVLRVAGYKGAELKDAGFNAIELKGAGFGASDLRSAGFSVKELREACFSVNELKAAGFSAADLRAAGFSVGELRVAGFSASDLKDAGSIADELKNSGFNAVELAGAGFTPDELKAARYTNGELVRAGVIASSSGSSAIVEVNLCSVEKLKKAHAEGVKLSEFKNRGCSASALKDAGYVLDELKVAGFGDGELKDAGFVVASSSVVNAKPGEENFTDSASLQDKLGKISDARMADMNDQEIANFIRQQQTMMQAQASQLFTSWTALPAQQYVQGETPVAANQAGQEEKTPTKEQQKAISLKNSDVYKSGTILFAVLDTEVNTDETSPVMATVVQQGPLRGSKVIGNFQRVSEKALLQFSVINVPKLTSSISIQAVAVDPYSDKTALASSVNNHYLLRYGTMLGSSFISGLGQAFQAAGSNIQTTNVGTVSAMPALNLMQKTVVAFGNMGQQLGTAMAPYMTMPPTVKVKAGISIGLLLMADLAVPKN